MVRNLAILAVVCTLFPLTVGPVAAQSSQPDTERLLAVQAALANARECLAENRSGEAVQLLEAHLNDAEGHRGYLNTLRLAYMAELNRLREANADSEQLRPLQTKLALIGGPTSPPPAAPETKQPTAPKSASNTTESANKSQGFDLLRQATAIFQQDTSDPRQLDLAARLFAAAFAKRIKMSDDQLAAWAQCRLKVVEAQLQQGSLDGEQAESLLAETLDALSLVEDNAALQAAGQRLISQLRGDTATKPAQPPTTNGSSIAVVETGSFRIRHTGQAALAEKLGEIAEAKRAEIFSRWSGPPAGSWKPKCDIVLHPNGESLAKATQQPPQATGHALVNLEEGVAQSRRIDLRADDPGVLDNALPRELTHVILADLFPTKAPPRWAIEGMAVLATTDAEQDRYLRTAKRCREAGELLPLPRLMQAKEPPREGVTGFFAGSVSLVEFLVQWKGEKAFTSFLRDCQRYGIPSAMKRQYGVDDAHELEETWIRATFPNPNTQ